MMKKTRIINSKICCVGLKMALLHIEQAINVKESGYICFSNVHTVVTGKTDERFGRVTNQATMALPDGMPLVWLARLRGCKEVGKCSGPDVMTELLKLSVKKGYTNFFYGSTDDNLQILQKKLSEDFPGLKIAGAYAPPFRALTAQEDQAIIKMINAVNPDIIWVGLGAPKQEIWMYEHVKQIKSSVMLGVGAAFNFHAGTVKRAPRWMQNIGLEWFFRLTKEPSKLWKRYLVTNSLFCFYLLCDIFRKNKPTIINKDKGDVSN
jgi:N-acetylglucosaminyldiphosphoundecaprenol N-acetyl-beta-D-mannosaminyltransferase